MSKFIIRMSVVVLATGLLLAACDNPAGGVETPSGGPDKTALNAKIAAAETALTGVTQVDSDGTTAADVPLGLQWAKPSQVSALEQAIAAAKSAATQEAVDAAVTVLTEALATFNTEVSGNGPGEKNSGFTQENLAALITQAETAMEGVVESDDGEDVPPSGFWVTDTVMAALTTAITSAKETDPVLDTVYPALAGALTSFNTAKTNGITPDKTALIAAITAAEEARAGVAIAANAAGAPSGSAWVRPEEWAALEGPYAGAVAIKNNEDATKNAVDAAVTALTGATSTFITVKTNNGQGTGPAALFTITGLSAICENNTEVDLALFETKGGEGDIPPDPPYFIEATVTDGSLTWDLSGKTGSYYAAFRIDEEGADLFTFVTKQPVNLNGQPITLDFDQNLNDDFTLWYYSMRLSDTDLDESMSLDAFFRDFLEKAENYAAWKTEQEDEIKSKLTNLALIAMVDHNLYKDATFTQPFSGADMVGPNDWIYCKFPLGDREDRGEQIGQIRGTIDLTNIPTPRPRMVEIKASGPAANGDCWSSYAHIVLPAEGASAENVAWTIPLCENDIEGADWSSIVGSREVVFSLMIVPAGSNNGYDIHLPSKTLNITSVDDINAGDLGDASLAYCTLTGTINLNLNGSIASKAALHRLYVYAGTEDNHEMGSITFNVYNNSSSIPWSVFIHDLDEETELTIGVDGWNRAGKRVFERLEAGSVMLPGDPGTIEVEPINLSVTLITLSGNITVTYDGQPAPRVRINVNALSSQFYASTVELESPAANTPWSMVAEAPASSTVVNFNVIIVDESDQFIDQRQNVLNENITVNDGDVTVGDIILSFSSP
jgi:hypothetical protein